MLIFDTSVYLPIKIGAIGVNSITLALENIFQLEWKEICTLERFDNTFRIIFNDNCGNGVWVDYRGFN